MGYVKPGVTVRYEDISFVQYRLHSSWYEKDMNCDNFKFHTIIPWPSTQRGLYPEPNEAYRPWLEENIGKQHDTWDWHIHSVVDSSIIIYSNNDAALNLFTLLYA